MINEKKLSIDNLQVISAYENCGMTVEEICSDFSYCKEAVELALLGGSDKYRLSLKKSNDVVEPLFNESTIRAAAKAIEHIANNSEMDGVRLKANIFIIDEAKGRNDIKAIANQHFSISMINEALANARMMMKRAKEKHQQAIEV